MTTVCKVLCLTALATMFISQVSAAEGFSLEGLLMPGKVISGHAEYEKMCQTCHETFKDKSQTFLCLDCHSEVRADIEVEQGFHGKIPDMGNTQCRTCHSEHLGRQADIVGLDENSFDHSQTDFLLTGFHQSTRCTDCHGGKEKYRQASSLCVDCHAKDDRHRTTLGNECGGCHVTERWQDIQFKHDEHADFQLRGNHQEIRCNACHPDEKYKNTPELCSSCHYLDDVHSGGNSQQCEACHDESGWKSISFNHNTDTQFSIDRAHKNLECNDCHKPSEPRDNIGSACIDCHLKDDAHNGRFGRKCSTCHEASRWQAESFDHDRDTSFSLLGSHAQVNCEYCHRRDLDSVQLGKDCVDCHLIEDVHQGQQGRQCSDCHNPEGWAKNVLFNHGITNFPLMGMHVVATCESCHSSKAFQDAPADCSGCHEADDIHLGVLGSNCIDCHNPNGWNLWLFDHAVQSGFVLEGMHLELNCDACHVVPAEEVVKLRQECITCHIGDDLHNRRFGRNCGRCHSSSAFSNIRMP